MDMKQYTWFEKWLHIDMNSALRHYLIGYQTWLINIDRMLETKKKYPEIHLWQAFRRTALNPATAWKHGKSEYAFYAPKQD